MLVPARAAFNLFPAHAGVIPATTVDVNIDLSVPRTRGGDPGFPGAHAITALCSPHTRG